MPVITLRALETSLGGFTTTPKATLTVDYFNGTTPFAVRDGEDVKLARQISIPIIDGNPAEAVDVPPTPEGCYARISVRGAGLRLYRINVLIPDTETVDVGDLVIVDPATLDPADPAVVTVASLAAAAADSALVAEAAAELLSTPEGRAALAATDEVQQAIRDLTWDRV